MKHRSKKQDILDLHSKGLKQMEIAEKLRISVHKVNTVIYTGKYNAIRYPNIKVFADERGLTTKQMHAIILEKVDTNQGLLKVLTS